MTLVPPSRHFQAGTSLTTTVPNIAHILGGSEPGSTSGLASKVRQSSDWATMAGHNHQLGWERGVEWSGAASCKFVPLLFEPNIYHLHCHAWNLQIMQFFGQLFKTPLIPPSPAPNHFGQQPVVGLVNNAALLHRFPLSPVQNTIRGAEVFLRYHVWYWKSPVIRVNWLL